jgi:hypothetical protein
MDDDFTFPTVAAPAPATAPAPAPAPEEQHNLEEVPLPQRFVGPITSPLWPFSSSPETKNTPEVDEADAPSTSTRTGGHAQAVRQHNDEDRMDLLWEDLNDDLKLPQRRRPDSSDTESEETSAGCAPTTMLRASSRAGGAGQFCGGSSRSGRGGRTTGWALLLRLFERLFAVDKRPPSRSPRHLHHGIYAP